MKEFTKMIHQLEIFIDDPEFYDKAFSFAAQQRRLRFAKDGDNFRRVCVEEFDDLSKRLDKTKFQESPSVRNILRTRRLANLLINDKGEINIAVLPRLIDIISNNLYSLGPNRQHDTRRQQHLLNVITLLNGDKEYSRLIQSITKPVSHKYADQMIRDTLQLPVNTVITDAHVRRAVLAAWMCFLRQNVGSCFATAPAIIIQDEQGKSFLKDLMELLSTGRLKRTFGGIEYSVPLSSSWGVGDLKKSFFVALGDGFEKNEVWLSPGLEAAFEAAEIINPELEAQEKSLQMKQHIERAIHSIEWNQPFIMISPEEIIHHVLLQKLNLKEKDLHDFENKPKNMIPTGLILQMSHVNRALNNKTELCSSYFSLFKVACNAFKGLSDNALLKAWEFSIASFAETKAQFTRWNLYSSLGLAPNDPDGIGECIFKILQYKLDESNRKIEDTQFEYEQLFHVLKTMESRMRHATSERDAQWLKIEYQNRRNEFYALEEIRNEFHYKSQRFTKLYDILVQQYDELFPRYFQEVYDADMHDIAVGQYDDSPAGFRLLYKHGRSNTSLWTLIKTPGEYIEFLASFFISTENEIASSEEWEGLDRDLSEIITAIVKHIRTREFLESSFYRMAAAHKTSIVQDPLEHLDRIEKKPWAYTSGGTMGTLVSCYYKLENKPTEVSRWVENPTELFVFFIDTMKQITPKLMKEYLDYPNKSMLVHSPTHAFLLKPGMSPFREGWMNEDHTYIWARDRIIQPKKSFVTSIELDPPMMQFLIEHLAKKVPENFRYYFQKVFGLLYGSMSPREFREHILDEMGKERGLRQGGATILTQDEIDNVLYTMLPLFPRTQLRERVGEILANLSMLGSKERQHLMEYYDLTTRPYSYNPVIDAQSLQNICKGLLCLTLEDSSSRYDYHQHISQIAQQLGYAMPEPILFADTNWVKDYFGFVLNPGSGNFELWRLDITGTNGFPMSHWNQWLNGSRKDITWGIYTKSYEYSS